MSIFLTVPERQSRRKAQISNITVSVRPHRVDDIVQAAYTEKEQGQGQPPEEMEGQ